VTITAITSTNAASPAPAPASGGNGGKGEGSGDFAELLSGLKQDSAPPPTGKNLPPKGQKAAAAGKPESISPEVAIIEGEEEPAVDAKSVKAKSEEPIVTPAFAWLIPVIPQETVTPKALSLPIAPPATAIDPAAPETQAIAIPIDAATIAENAIALDPAATSAVVEAHDITDSPSIDGVMDTTGPADMTAVGEAPATSPATPHRGEARPSMQFASQPAAAQPTPTVQASALTAFADMLGGDQTANDTANAATDIGSSSPITPTAFAAAPQARPIEAAVPTTDTPVVDTTRTDWIESMIDHIGELRDMGGNRVAQIRLTPDALGAVDIRIRQDGDAVHVSFASDNPQARALIAEAAPKLVEMAEQRGVRLSGSSVDAGLGGTGTGAQSRSDGQQRSAASARAPENSDDVDARTASALRAGDRIA